MWIKNFILCKKYPFLIVRNRFTGKKYGYKTTELDYLPTGWRKTFGIKICKDIKNVLKKSSDKNFWKKEYRITQIKEKYGSLRWYSGAIPVDVADEYNKVIDKYEKISAETCISCGEKTEIKNHSGWFEPICDICERKYM